MSEKKTTKELQITSSKLENMSTEQLENFAEEKSKFILEKIEFSVQKISEAKEAAEAASNMRSGWFGKTGKKADATANAVITTNEAVAEMNELLQESIRFTCLTFGFAQTMSKHMSALILNGFKNHDGEFIELSDNSKEQALYIVQQAEAFAKNQLELEIRQAAQDSKINDFTNKVLNNESRLDEKDLLDKEQSEKIISLSNENKEQNKKLSEIHFSLSEKEKIDEEQSQRLEELGTLLSNKDLVDQKQEEAITKNSDAIKVLFEYAKQKDILDKEQSEEIERIKKFSSKKLCIAAIIISVCALVCSVASIVLQFIM